MNVLKRYLLGCSLAVACVRLALPAAAGDKPSSEAARFFESKVRPVLVENCFKCHVDKQPKGGLWLDSRAALLAGGDNGPAVVPGKPEESLLIKALSHDGDLKMPPKKKLASQQIADLTQWVKIGVPWPEFRITEQDQAHWSFQPLKRPAVPVVRDGAWAANPVDAFLKARLDASKLIPNPPAARRELIRRVCYDLTGLPPTPTEVAAFVADDSPGAYERLVDRLLESPRYGEKWGRHWLDLVRFAETNSYERDGPKPHTWRYRDYVIRSFNADKPYDRFLREQLAGDELPDADADTIIATGFYRLGIWDDEPSDRDLARYDGLDDIVATTGQVFLGLTFDCARCHDHKIDPIPQKDYYQLVSFFHNINHFRNGGSTDEVVLTAGSDGRAGFEYIPREKERPDDFRQPIKPAAAPERALCVTEAGPKASETFVLLRGNPQLKGDKVTPGFPQILGGGLATVPTPSPAARTTGRRLALANWIASPDNPLTARVMVNRLWQHHFGRGLVRSPNDFGLQGDKPTHPELLDWLAVEFIAQGWRLKPLHRLMVTSRAYRMSSRGNPMALAADPTNNLLWRFDMRRLTGEEIRDSILAVSGTLNLKMYGPGIYVDIPREVLAGQSMPGKGWGKSPPAEQNRRSVYIHVKRSLLTPILETFDAPDTDRSVPARFATTQPGQALGMLNSEFVNKQAAVFAERLRREAGDDVGKQVELGLNLVLCRQPRAGETRRGVELVKGFDLADKTQDQTAVRYFCLMALNLNEFLYLD